MIYLLDGSIGRELAERGANVNGPLWAANCLYENIDLLYDVHCDYLSAGSNIVTTNTYGLKPVDFINKSNGKKELAELYKIAFNVLEKAILNKNKKALIAFSVPPLRDTYNSSKVISYRELIEEYSIILQLTDNFPNHIVIAETLSTIREVEAVIACTRQYNRKIWVSVTLDSGEKLRSGESLKDLLISLEINCPDALLFNCSPPEDIGSAITMVGDYRVKYLYGGYANRFPKIKKDYSFNVDGPNILVNELTPELYLEHVKNWMKNGSSIFGGCCGIGPKYITAIYDYFILTNTKLENV